MSSLCEPLVSVIRCLPPPGEAGEGIDISRVVFTTDTSSPMAGSQTKLAQAEKELTMRLFWEGRI